MKFSKSNKISLALLAVLAGITLMAASVPAFAIPPNQAVFFEGTGTLTGACCFTWNESVTITEPAQVAPVVVTWNSDYQSNAYDFNGLIINGQPCASYGPSAMPQGEPLGGQTYTHTSFQWVVTPANGLKAGKNTITLCGGGGFGSSETLLGFNTLVVQISK